MAKQNSQDSQDPQSSQSASSLPPITNVNTGPATAPTEPADDAAVRQKMQEVINTSPQLSEYTRNQAQQMLDAPPGSENSLAEHRRVNNPVSGAWGVPPTIGPDGVMKVWHLGQPIQPVAERAQNAIRLDITANGSIYAYAHQSATPPSESDFQQMMNEGNYSDRWAIRERPMFMNNDAWIRISGPGPDYLTQPPKDIIGSTTATPDLITQLNAASGTAGSSSPDDLNSQNVIQPAASGQTGAHTGQDPEPHDPAMVGAGTGRSPAFIGPAVGADGGQDSGQSSMAGHGFAQSGGHGQDGSGGGHASAPSGGHQGEQLPGPVAFGSDGGVGNGRGPGQRYPNLGAGVDPKQMQQLLENAMNMPGGWPPANPGLRHQMHDQLRAAAGQLKEPGGHSGSADMAGFGGGASDPTQGSHSQGWYGGGGGSGEGNPLGGFSADAHAGHDRSGL